MKLLYDEVGYALAQQDTRDRITGTGLEPVAQAPGAFQQWIASEAKRWAEIVKDARIPTE